MSTEQALKSFIDIPEQETLLPQGRAEFDVWADDIISTYKMPNNDSIKFALAVAITHLDPTKDRMPKEYFGRLLRKGAATQVAFAVMDELKVKQQKAASDAASQAQKDAAATTPIYESKGT